MIIYIITHLQRRYNSNPSLSLSKIDENTHCLTMPHHRVSLIFSLTWYCLCFECQLKKSFKSFEISSSWSFQRRPSESLIGDIVWRLRSAVKLSRGPLPNRLPGRVNGRAVSRPLARRWSRASRGDRPPAPITRITRITRITGDYARPQSPLATTIECRLPVKPYG